MKKKLIAQAITLALLAEALLPLTGTAVYATAPDATVSANGTIASAAGDAEETAETYEDVSETLYECHVDLSDILHPTEEVTEVSPDEATEIYPEAERIALDVEADRFTAIKNLMRSALYNRQNSVDVSGYGITRDELSAAMDQLRDEAFLFFWKQSYSYSYNTSGEVVRVAGLGYISADQENAIRQNLSIALSESVTDDMSDLQKAIALHDWVSGNVTYDDTYSKHDVYDALVGRNSVCQGYAETYGLLCSWVGIENHLITGGNHAWNRVKIGGNWYSVDCTWDENIGYSKSGMAHVNLLKSDSYMASVTGHIDASSERYCTDTSWDSGTYWDDRDRYSDSGYYFFGPEGCYFLRWADRSTCNLVFRSASTGSETVVRSFTSATNTGTSSVGWVDSWVPMYKGVGLDRLGQYLYVNDMRYVYRFDPKANTWEVIHDQGSNTLMGLNVYQNKLTAYTSSNSFEIATSGTQQTYDTSTAACAAMANPGVSNFVKRLYTICLGRTYDANGLADWSNKLSGGEMDASAVASGFFFSNEFKNKNLSDSDFVDVMYKTMMGREADAGGKAYWIKMLSYGVTREYVYQGFTCSDEFTKICDDYGVERGNYQCNNYRDKNAGATGFISRLYTKMLGRGYDENGLEYWCQKYMSGEQSIETVATNGFLHSQELKNMNLSNEEYVKRMYETFLDRQPDESGLNYWLDQLRTGQKDRDTLVYGFTLSQEFANIKKSYGLN